MLKINKQGKNMKKEKCGEVMKKKEMKFETMLSYVWCWDCDRPLEKGMKTDKDCKCKY